MYLAIYIYIQLYLSIYTYAYIYICAYVCCMFFTYTNMVHWYTCTTSLQGITKSQSALAWSNGLEAKLWPVEACSTLMNFPRRLKHQHLWQDWNTLSIIRTIFPKDPTCVIGKSYAAKREMCSFHFFSTMQHSAGLLCYFIDLFPVPSPLWLGIMNYHDPVVWS